MDHTGTLTHTTNSNRLTANLNLNSNLFLFGISSHDRLRRLSTSLQRTIQLRRHHLHTILNTVNGNLHTNHTCRSNQHTVSSHPKNLSSRICSLLAITIPFCTSTCIGNTTVTDHHLCRRMIINNILIPFNRRSLHHIGSKSPRSHTRHLTVNHSHICSALILNLSRSRRCLKSLSRRNTALYNLHKVLNPFYNKMLKTIPSIYSICFSFPSNSSEISQHFSHPLCTSQRLLQVPCAVTSVKYLFRPEKSAPEIIWF